MHWKIKLRWKSESNCVHKVRQGTQTLIWRFNKRSICPSCSSNPEKSLSFFQNWRIRGLSSLFYVAHITEAAKTINLEICQRGRSSCPKRCDSNPEKCLPFLLNWRTRDNSSIFYNRITEPVRTSIWRLKKDVATS